MALTHVNITRGNMEQEGPECKTFVVYIEVLEGPLKGRFIKEYIDVRDSEDLEEE